jgi:hypothetical protein
MVDLSTTDLEPSGADRFDPSGGEGLRQRAARGTLINAAFLAAINLIGFLRGFVVAAFLTVADYGIWGLLVVSLATLLFLVQIGIDDKYIQQDAPDQEEAFQLAFTLQCLVCGSFMVLILAGMPLYALAYGEWDILLPGYVFALRCRRSLCSPRSGPSTGGWSTSLSASCRSGIPWSVSW